jgi:tetratricopeptide (TPR) repeat protein
MTNYLRLVGDCDGALDAGRRARTIAAALGDRTLEIRATYQLAMVYRQLGDNEQAIRAYRSVVDFLQGELLHERFGEPSVLSVHARSWLASTLADVGQFPDAIASGEEAVRIAEEARNAFSLTNAHLGLGLVYTRQGHFARAIPLLERSVSLCREGDFDLLLPRAASALGAALTLAGRLEDALPLLELSVETAGAKGLIGGCSLLVIQLGQAKLLAGHTDEAHNLGARALDVARKYRERGNEAWAQYLLGDLAMRAGSPDFAAAAVHYDEAMAAAGALSIRTLVAHCHAALGELYGLAGQNDRSRHHLISATTMFREMDMRFWLERAQAAVKEW